MKDATSERGSVLRSDLELRIRSRLRSGTTSATDIVWTSLGDELLLHLGTVKLAMTSGWLSCDLSLEATGTGKQPLQLLYFLGRDDDGDGLAAATTLRAPTASSLAIAERWGSSLQRVVWDGVLDVIEGVLDHAASLHSGQEIVLLGFGCSSTELFVDYARGVS